MSDDYLDASRYAYFKPQPYYARRLYGKYTIYNKDGAIVAKGLNQKEMENYMKLLKEEN
jgi:hypothetical protein